MKPYKKRIPTWITVLASALLILAPALFMTFKIINTQGISCTVCISFDGQDVCKNASGPSKEECQRTGLDNACGALALGMTNSIQCTNKGPAKVTFNN